MTNKNTDILPASVVEDRLKDEYQRRSLLPGESEKAVIFLIETKGKTKDQILDITGKERTWLHRVLSSHKLRMKYGLDDTFSSRLLAEIALIKDSKNQEQIVKGLKSGELNPSIRQIQRVNKQRS